MYFACIKKKNLLKALALVLVAVISLTTLFTTEAHAVFYGSNLRKLPIYYVSGQDKKIAVSFDCAWGVDYTDRLLEIMDKYKVRCTFFTVEFWAEKYPEYLKKISDAGHEIGTHSATHPYMSKLSKSAIIKELTTSSQAIEGVTGKRVELFRPPYGDYSDKLITTAQELGLYTIQWSVDSLDWKNLSANDIYRRVTDRVKGGDIVLFHNQGLHTAEALPSILTELLSRGYEFVPIGELIYRGDYTILPDGGQRQST